MSNMTSKQFLENLAVVRADMAENLPASRAIDKLLNDKQITSNNLTQKDVEDIQRLLTNGFYKPVNNKSTAARVLLNIVPILLTGSLFHLMYWAVNSVVVAVKNAKENSLSGIFSRINPFGENKPKETAKFRWDWTKSFPKIGRMYTSMKLTKALIDAEVNTDVELTEFNNDDVVQSFTVNTDGLDEILQGDYSSSSSEEDGQSFAQGQQMWKAEAQLERDTQNGDVVLDSDNEVEFNRYL